MVSKDDDEGGDEDEDESGIGDSSREEDSNEGGDRCSTVGVGEHLRKMYMKHQKASQD